MALHQPKPNTRRSAPRLVVLLLALAVTAGAAADGTRFELSAYSGQARVPDSRLRYEDGADTRLNLGGVSWESESFEAPLYFGLRLSHWLRHRPHLGLALDYAHPKIALDPNQNVHVSGIRDGLAVDGEERIGATLDTFGYGLNLLTLNLLYRWNPDAAIDRGFSRRLQPYLGLGVGIAVPHLVVEVEGRRTDAYRFAGPVGQGLAGVRYAATEHVGLFAEYKFSQVRAEESLNGGGSLRLDPRVHQFVLGLSYAF